MTSNEEIMEVEDSNGDSYGTKVKQRFRDPKKVRFLYLIRCTYYIYTYIYECVCVLLRRYVFLMSCVGIVVFFIWVVGYTSLDCVLDDFLVLGGVDLVVCRKWLKLRRCYQSKQFRQRRSSRSKPLRSLNRLKSMKDSSTRYVGINGYLHSTIFNSISGLGGHTIFSCTCSLHAKMFWEMIIFFNSVDCICSFVSSMIDLMMCWLDWICWGGIGDTFAWCSWLRRLLLHLGCKWVELLFSGVISASNC